MTPHNKHDLEFTGNGTEFFKIWIVNVMLSIVTLGFYSPWAKVRTKRYFYGNTLLTGSAFDYLGDPIKILKGRLIALLLLIIYSAAGTSPILQGVLTLLFMPLLPWIIIKALRFNAFNSAYRNIRFAFHARYSEALGVFVGMPFLVALSAGLAYPFFVRARKKFVIDHTAYGTSPFALHASSGDFYKLYLKASGIMLLLFVVFTAIGYGIIGKAGPMSHDELAALMVFVPFLFMPFAVIIFAYIYTETANLVINQMTIEKHHFESRLSWSKMCWLYFSNAILIILTLGLFIPWAMTRTAAYRISCISVYAEGSIDTFIASETERAEAIGEEIGDMFDLDIGL